MSSESFQKRNLNYEGLNIVVVANKPSEEALKNFGRKLNKLYERQTLQEKL